MPTIAVDNRKTEKTMALKQLEDSNSSGKKEAMKIAFCVACNNLIVAMNHTAPTFFTYTPPFNCKGFEYEDPCHIRINRTIMTASDTTQTCPTSYEYYPARNEENIITEWNLVCDQKLYAALSVTWYFVAVGIGSMITGTLTDKYGRKTMLYVCLYSNAVISLMASILANSYLVYVLLRFCQGLFMQGIMTSMTLIINETLPTKYRTFGSGLICLFWPVGLVILSILAYFIPNWRYLNGAICCISIALPTLFITLVPESPIWLESQKAKKTNGGACTRNGHCEANNSIITKKKPVVIINNDQKTAKDRIIEDGGKINEAFCESVKSAADEDKLNNGSNSVLNNAGIITTNGTYKSQQEKSEIDRISVQSDNDGDSFWSLLKVLLGTRQLRNRLFMMMVLWFTEAISYFGVTFSITEQAGNHYANFLTGAFLEEFCYAMMLLAMYRFRRKRLACFVYATATLCYAGVILLSFGTTNFTDTLRTFLLNLSKSCVTAVFAVLMLYAVEIFPTRVRGMSLGVCFVGHRIATLSSPVLLLLANVWSQLPYLVLAILNILSLSIAYFCLPEKRDKLPTTVRETIEQQKQTENNAV